MKLTPVQKKILEGVVNAFETGTAEGRYDAITILRDGPHELPQITYGRSQTTEYGNLRLLIEQYVAARGRYSMSLAAYLDDIGWRPLSKNRAFLALLQRAGQDDPLMRQVQDCFFDQRYFAPAMQWARNNGFTLPLSALVIYDSFIHSGSILWGIRGSFPESPPAACGEERLWISAYVKARHRFLAAHSRPIVRRTIYRPECFAREIGRGNWHLQTLPIVANGVGVGGMRLRVPIGGVLFADYHVLIKARASSPRLEGRQRPVEHPVRLQSPASDEGGTCEPRPTVRSV